jgi:hypothetical protein
LHALGGRDLPWVLTYPLLGILSALTLIVVGLVGNHSSSIGLLLAIALLLYILALLLEQLAVITVISVHSNVLPWGGVPVGVVVTLLRALESVTVSIVVLTSVDCSVSNISLSNTVGNEQSQVAVTGLACAVERVRLVHSVYIFSGSSILLVHSCWVGGNSSSGCSITNIGFGWSVCGTAHVLENHVARHLGVSTSVLGGPLDGELGSLVIAHGGTYAVSTTSVVLGIA